MNHTHEGLSLWYCTPDAIAPDYDAVLPRSGVALVVGVHPANPTNRVIVRYRVDGGHVQTVPGRELRTDYQREAQYFAVKFPTFPTGDLVEFAPLLTCAGRQVPAPHLAERFPSRFRLAAREMPASRAVQSPVALRGLRFAARLDFVAAVEVHFDIDFVADTPAGMRVNFLVREGTVEGRGFRAKVTRGSSDQMIIRRDGMGEIRIRAGFATEDGAVLDVESGGYVDFGAEGYRRALAHNLPDRSPLVVSPLISTRHPKYRWLNRVQCVGAGQTHLDARQASYRVYTAMPRDVPPTR